MGYSASFKNNCIRRLETYEEIRKVIGDFDKIFEPALSARLLSINDFAKKLSDNAFMYVAEEENKVLGFVTFYANDQNLGVAYLTLIAVSPEFQKRKIGKALLDLYIKVSKGNNMNELRLEVFNHNHKAISFYERNGFEFCGKATPVSMYMKRKL